MGNHEYCTACGENDFHWGQPCNPEKFKAHQDEQARIKAAWEKRVENTKKKLDAAGIKYSFYDGRFSIWPE